MECDSFVNKIQQKMNETFISQNSELLDTVFEIDGKKLYADKLRLSLASSTFKSMLSDRWNSNKNDAIKIKEYKFEDFKELLNFIYSGKCNITDSNISTMIDMAEFYQIDDLKELCDKYLSNMEITINNVIELIETSYKYSMVKMTKSLCIFITQNFTTFVKCDSFLNAEKLVINEILNYKLQVLKEEDKFQAVYAWAEYQAIKKQKESNEENFNLNDAIKNEISNFLPYISFKKMKLDFLIKYVVKRGFLFSCDELSDILDAANSDCKVKVTNSDGQSIHGIIPNHSDAVDVIQSLKNCPSENIGNIIIFWNKQCKIPSTPSPLKRRKEIKWYLSYFKSGNIGVINGSDIWSKDYYLLAEMIAEDTDFKITKKCKIEII